MSHFDDLYGLDPVMVIIRVSPSDQRKYEKGFPLGPDLDNVRGYLRDRELACTFRNLGKGLHCLIIPLEKGYWLPVVTEDKKSGTYLISARHGFHTGYAEKIDLADQNTLQENCYIRIVDEQAGGRENRATDDFYDLREKVERLPVSSCSKVRDQRDIWFAFIQAQMGLVESLKEPLAVKGKPEIKLEETSNGSLRNVRTYFSLRQPKPSGLNSLLSVARKKKWEEGRDGRTLKLKRSQIQELDQLLTDPQYEGLLRRDVMRAVLKVRPKKGASFPINFWQNVQKDAGLLATNFRPNPAKDLIFLEFTREEQLRKVCQLVEQHCDIVFHPRNEDFTFKVVIEDSRLVEFRTQITERIEALGGVGFKVVVKYERGEDNKAETEIFNIGDLSYKNSNPKHLEFNLQVSHAKDRKEAQRFLKLIEEDGSRIREVFPDLAGEEARISWLERAVQKVKEPNTSPNGGPINPNLKDFIFDSSRAQAPYDPTKVKLDSEAGLDFKKNQLLSLNPDQQKAVLAALYCPDLALLQGPPGTGKTTVIAEMIWQMIRKHPACRILLTSETNLAVDNALDRLLDEKSGNPMLKNNLTLIKPLRFGRIGRLDEEGARFALSRIRKWVDPNYESEEEGPFLEDLDSEEELPMQNSESQNAIQVWMKRIAERSRHQDPKYQKVLRKWVEELSFPDPAFRQHFAALYIDHANVIGSTCSSAGSPHFMWDFAEVFGNFDVGEWKSQYNRCKYRPYGKDFYPYLQKQGLPQAAFNELKKKASLYFGDKNFLQTWFQNGGVGSSPEDAARFAMLDTQASGPLHDVDDRNRLKSYRELQKYARGHVLPYLEVPIRFDTVIMDEASKASPPELLLPLCFGQKSVIIGDHRQLPPMLHEKDLYEALVDAGKGDLAKSIDKDFVATSQFERLILNPNVSPQIIARCTRQYRMHPHINAVIRQFYMGDGGLEPAPQLQRDADLSDLNLPFSRYHGLEIPGLLTPDVHTLWVDVPHPERREGTSYQNEVEAEAIQILLELLSRAKGFKVYQDHWNGIRDDFKRQQQKEIGVISFYGAQKRLLRQVLRGSALPLKINTVDRFQGMERNIVIVSTVRSHRRLKPGGQETPNTDSGFAKSPQRLNVALSRARRLLIVVGNREFFSSVRDRDGQLLYLEAINEIKKHGKIVSFSHLQSIYHDKT